MEEIDRLNHRIALRLKALRAEAGLSLDDLAARSGLSRATLSRLENAETSPTTEALARLAAAYGMTLTRIVHLAEEAPMPLMRRADQPIYEDATLAFHRRSVSPPAKGFQAEMLECHLGPGQVIAYALPPRPGLEHHLLLLEGALDMMVEGETYHLEPGDCLRFRLTGASRFTTAPDMGARYILTLVP